MEKKTNEKNFFDININTTLIYIKYIIIFLKNS